MPNMNNYHHTDHNTDNNQQYTDNRYQKSSSSSTSRSQYSHQMDLSSSFPFNRSSYTNHQHKSRNNKYYNTNTNTNNASATTTSTATTAMATMLNNNDDLNDKQPICTYGDWSEFVSTSNGRTYYYNCKTEKTQWEKPDEWLLQLDNNIDVIHNKNIKSSSTDYRYYANTNNNNSGSNRYIKNNNASNYKQRQSDIYFNSYSNQRQQQQQQQQQSSSSYYQQKFNNFNSSSYNNNASTRPSSSSSSSYHKSTWNSNRYQNNDYYQTLTTSNNNNYHHHHHTNSNVNKINVDYNDNNEQDMDISPVHQSQALLDLNVNVDNTSQYTLKNDDLNIIDGNSPRDDKRSLMNKTHKRDFDTTRRSSRNRSHEQVKKVKHDKRAASSSSSCSSLSSLTNRNNKSDDSIEQQQQQQQQQQQHKKSNNKKHQKKDKKHHHKQHKQTRHNSTDDYQRSREDTKSNVKIELNDTVDVIKNETTKSECSLEERVEVENSIKKNEIKSSSPSVATISSTLVTENNLKSDKYSLAITIQMPQLQANIEDINKFYRHDLANSISTLMPSNINESTSHSSIIINDYYSKFGTYATLATHLKSLRSLVRLKEIEKTIYEQKLSSLQLQMDKLEEILT